MGKKAKSRDAIPSLIKRQRPLIEPASRDRLRILFTCVGRRVSLLQAFREGLRKRGLQADLMGTDTTELSAALQICDEKFLVKPTGHRDYLKQLRQLVRTHGIQLMVPTVDLDLLALAQAREQFMEQECRVLVSPEQTIRICQDKRKTHRFLERHGFGHPATASVRSVMDKTGDGRGFHFPCFLKPWDGYASRGNAVVKNRKELSFYGRRIRHAICQELITGRELTCDTYVDFQGRVRCVVPRQRLEVRAGEVSKARVVMNEAVIAEVTRLVEILQAGPGVITVQVMVTADDQLRFIEINPRFGGGVPLSIAAGAHFPAWILAELTGQRPRFESHRIQDGLTMLRYDAEVWLGQEC